jgi:hypothetical protein
MNKIKADLDKLYSITEQIANNISIETKDITEIQTNTESISQLLSSANEYMQTINCDNCSDEDKLNKTVELANRIVQSIISIPDTPERNTYINQFLIAIFNDTVSENGFQLFYNTNPSPEQVIKLKRFIYYKLIQKLKKENIIKDDQATLERSNVIAKNITGGSRYKRKRSVKRPRKRRGLRSKSRRAPKRRTRKYRSHKYRR